MFDPKTMRARFAELTELIESIEKVSMPLRAERDGLIQKFEPRVRELERQFKEIEKPLFDLKQEKGVIVRALNGKTG